MPYLVARGVWIPCRSGEAVRIGCVKSRLEGTYSCILEKALGSILDIQISGAKIDVTWDTIRKVELHPFRTIMTIFLFGGYQSHI